MQYIFFMHSDECIDLLNNSTTAMGAINVVNIYADCIQSESNDDQAKGSAHKLAHKRKCNGQRRRPRVPRGLVNS